MKKLVLGSLNIDRSYQVAAFVRPKETVAAQSYTCSCGGKGFNQAIALARAGSQVYFAGSLGTDGTSLCTELERDGVRTELIRTSQSPTGHAVIQVDKQGQNCIIVVSGANAEVDRDYIDQVLTAFSTGDLIVLQNEIPNVAYAIEAAHKKGMLVAFNPSPFNEEAQNCALAHVDILLINEVEGAAITGMSCPDEILSTLHAAYPNQSVVLTLGEGGAVFLSQQGVQTKCPAIRCTAVDTTAAGDTFAGYFLTTYLKSGCVEQALALATVASSLTVCRTGSACSIPTLREAEAFSAALSRA